VNRPEFNAFARSLDLPKRYPGLQGIGSSGPAVPSPGETQLTFGDRTFVLRYAPLAGNPILTGRTIPASLLWLLAQMGSL
jgi:hypothetical protein